MTPRPRFFAFVLGATVLVLSGCARDWPSYRYNQHRSGHQPWFGELSDPDDVPSLKVDWTWPSSGSEGGSFRASPIVYEHRVFIGSTSGFFYALDHKTGNKLWQYPDPGPPLLGTCTQNALPHRTPLHDTPKTRENYLLCRSVSFVPFSAVFSRYWVN
jgi:hypothetical protein